MSENHPIEACLAIDLGWRPSVGGFAAKEQLAECTWAAAGKNSIHKYL